MFQSVSKSHVGTVLSCFKHFTQKNNHFSNLHHNKMRVFKDFKHPYEACSVKNKPSKLAVNLAVWDTFAFLLLSFYSYSNHSYPTSAQALHACRNMEKWHLWSHSANTSQPLLELNRAPDKLHHGEQTDASSAMWKKKQYVANIFLTVVVRVFPSRPLPLSPLRHHGAGLCVIVQAVPTARCLPTSDRDGAEKPELVLKKRWLYTASLSKQNLFNSH